MKTVNTSDKYLFTVAGVPSADGKTVTVGVSPCFPWDNFCRRQGRNTSIGRAKKCPSFTLKVDEDYDPSDIYYPLRKADEEPSRLMKSLMNCLAECEKRQSDIAHEIGQERAARIRRHKIKQKMTSALRYVAKHSDFDASEIEFPS